MSRENYDRSRHPTQRLRSVPLTLSSRRSTFRSAIRWRRSWATYSQLDVFGALDIAADVESRQSTNLVKAAEALFAELKAKGIVTMEREVCNDLR
jgi:hypothetical protein